MQPSEEHKNTYKALLDKLFNQVMKNLKRKMYPRKHMKLLHRNVVIDNQILDGKTIGRYMTIERTRYDYDHKIIIDSKIILDYLTAIPGFKRYYLNRIKNTIAHEIIHAYVKEEYGYILESSFYDGSPIFLSILTFLGIHSGHAAMKSFARTKLYKKVKQYTEFKNLNLMLLNEVWNYKQMFENLEEMIVKNKVLLNEFEFSNGKVTGVKGLSTLTMITDGIVGKANRFEIGVCAEIENIRDLILKKIETNSFDEKNFPVDKKEAIKVQHMNI